MQKIGSFFQAFLTPVALFLLAAVVVHDHIQPFVEPGNPPAVNGKSLGRSYAPTVAANLGDAWLAGADALEQGKTVTEAQAALQLAWQAARGKSFEVKVVPEFIKVLPEGQEPNTPAARAEVVKLWRDFAAGLKGGR
jgi:hypothetical protein